jgi:hypothetical protein
MRRSPFTICAIALGLAATVNAQESPQPRPFVASSPAGDTLPLRAQFDGVYIRTGDSLLILVSAAAVRAAPDAGDTRLRAVKVGLGEAIADADWSLAFQSAPVSVNVDLRGGDAAQLVTLAFVLRLSPDIDLSGHWIVFCLDDASPDDGPLGLAHSDRRIFELPQR